MTDSPRNLHEIAHALALLQSETDQQATLAENLETDNAQQWRTLATVTGAAADYADQILGEAIARAKADRAVQRARRVHH